MKWSWIYEWLKNWCLKYKTDLEYGKFENLTQMVGEIIFGMQEIWKFLFENTKFFDNPCEIDGFNRMADFEKKKSVQKGDVQNILDRISSSKAWFQNGQFNILNVTQSQKYWFLTKNILKREAVLIWTRPLNCQNIRTVRIFVAILWPNLFDQFCFSYNPVFFQTWK